MKEIKLLAALLVSWRVMGSVIAPCPQEGAPDPMLGYCAQTVDVVRSISFADKKSADDWIAKIKNYKKFAPITLGDIHVYSEEGAK